MSVTGEWVNSYGSLMDLKENNSGAVIGVYSSTTGSSGKYFVLGFTDPNPPTDGTGQSLALSIFWRSIQGKEDPSWHYVSGFSGQLVTLPPNNVPTLSLVHDLVATTPFDGVVSVTGNFMDKLLYTPYTPGNAAPAQWPPRFSPAASPVDGKWVCVQNPSIRLSLALEDKTLGYMTGSLQTSGGTVPIAGFTDSYASQSGLTLQGVTFCALLPDGHSVVSVAGSLNLQQDVMTMAWFLGVGTKPDMTWIESNLQGLNFKRG